MSANQITVRFAGDSGDGMQLTGDRLAKISAIFGNEVSTLADYPAEIRAPQGTLYGVSGYQLQIGTKDIYSPGDEVDILLAMNPAALVANLSTVKNGGLIIVDKDAFTQKNFEKINIAQSPLEDGSLAAYKVSDIPISELTKSCLASTGLTPKEMLRCKNFFALGVVCWILDRQIETTKEWIRQKFSKIPEVAEANVLAFNEGFTAGLVRDLHPQQNAIEVKEEKLANGIYRFVTGNTALSLGLITASQKSQKKLFFGSYPITPASDVLHELSKHRNFGVTTFQAEDEIAAIGSAIGASYAGSLAVTCTSGPGLALKGEFLNLAVMTELPLVVLNIQRAGPSTGMPTKTEQSDLAMALWGRNGDSPVVVIAPNSPADCFNAAFEAAKIAMTTMTPVVLLSDAYLANGYETWKVPESSTIEAIRLNPPAGPDTFKPYSRDENLSRPWVHPGMKDYEHRIGGLEKEDITGNVCYTPENHQKMTNLRAQKVKNIAKSFPALTVEGNAGADILFVGWGSTYGIIKKAVQIINNHSEDETSKKSEVGISSGAAHIHLRYLNPLHQDLGDHFRKFKKIVVFENNSGQAVIKLRSELSDLTFESFTKVSGQPFSVGEIVNKFKQMTDKLS